MLEVFLACFGRAIELLICFLLCGKDIKVFSEVKNQRKYLASGRKQDRDYQIKMAK